MTASSADTHAACTDSQPPSPGSSSPDHVLGRKLAALVRLKLDSSVTHLYGRGVRRHVRDAIRAGATRAEALEVMKLSTVVGIHAMAVGVPILDHELACAQEAPEPSSPTGPTPVCNMLRETGQFNPAWDAIYDAAPDWLEGFLANAVGRWSDGVLPPLWVELLCIAGDASVTHMYNSGTRRHIRGALTLGATREQIQAVLDIVARQGDDALEVASEILSDVCSFHLTEGGQA